MSKPLLVLDFEGVICDSTQEVARLTWHAGACHSFEKMRGMQGHPIDSVLLQQVAHVRCFARHLGHFQVALVPDAHKVKTPEELEALYASLDAISREQFLARATLLRTQWREQEPRWWLSMLTLYRGMGVYLRRQKTPIFIVTGRDQASVLAFLENKRVVVPPDRIWGTCVSKQEALLAIAQTEHRAPSQLFFVDDQLAHVQAARQAGIRASLATWGNAQGTDALPPVVTPVPTISLRALLAG